MLVIDDNMFKLAKMQETLLKVSEVNKKENLDNYKKTVAQIDEKAYSDILEEIKHIDEHNQSLEEELNFLDSIKNTYNQLLELQLSFKRICEVYGNAEIELSDLSKINIEYIENRVNAINGYLMNLKNIDVNKEKLIGLNDKLIEEEKKKISLDKKLLELENTLRINFSNSEGRTIVDGKLVYTSVITEYEKIGLDFNKLCNDNDYLNKLLNYALEEKKDISDKVKVAEVCYNNMLSSESRQILNEVNTEFLKTKYKVVMLKIVELLVQNNDNYDLFVKKREELLELVKYRLSYMEQLGMKTSIDPFGRTKIQEQLDIVLSFADNSQTINMLRKEISKLNSWVEEMISQNNNYLVTLNDTRDLIESSFGINDIDISTVVSFDELIVKQEVAFNQVISVRNISSKLNMSKVYQKTENVIRRVMQMIGTYNEEKKEPVSEVVPELVIVSSVLGEEKLEEKKSDDVNLELKIIEDNEFLDSDELEEEEKIESKLDTSLEIFETVIPFSEPSLFTDRRDDDNLDKKVDDLEVIVQKPELTLYENVLPELNVDLKVEPIESDEIIIEEDDEIEEMMPEAFWSITEDKVEKDNDDSISFDEQINALLSIEIDDTGKVRKKVA